MYVKGVVISGYFRSRFCKPLAAGNAVLMPVVVNFDVIPLIEKSVVSSVRDRDAMSTLKLKRDKKSATRIGVLTCAIVKSQENDLRKPRFNVNEVSPKVSMRDPFAACKLKLAFLAVMPGLGGMTLTWAPVSTRKRYPEFLSPM